MNNISLARTAIAKGQVYGLILAGGNAKRLEGIADADLNATACCKPNVLVLTGSAIDYSVRAYEQMGLRDIFVLTTPQQASQIEQQIYRPKNPDQKVKMWIESRPMGTARSVNDFIKSVAFKLGHNESHLENLTFMIMGSDNPNNAGSDDPEQHTLMRMLDNHLQSDAGGTVGITRIGMHSNEWEERSFATVVPDGLDYKARDISPSEYEEMLDRYYLENIGQVKQITGFCEQSEQKERDERITNFISTGFYAINGAFWIDNISPHIKHNFSDFGFHIFPAMASFSTVYDSAHNIPFQKIKAAMRSSRFNAYFLPEERNGLPVFWCDVGTPLLLYLANMRGLMGEFGEPMDFGKVWTKQPWGLVGQDTEIDDQARIKMPQESDTKFDPIGTIIGRNCRIKRFVHLKNCVVGDNVTLEEKVHLENVVVLPGSPQKPTFISKLKLRNGIIAGGSIPGKVIESTIDAAGAILFRSPSGDLIISKLSKDK